LIVDAFYIKESRLSKLNPDTSIMDGVTLLC
jgi:hypothetical protein